jgi:hypothetical protein
MPSEWNNGMLECWNIGILGYWDIGIRAEINHFNCKKLLKPIIPLFQLGRSP